MNKGKPIKIQYYFVRRLKAFIKFVDVKHNFEQFSQCGFAKIESLVAYQENEQKSKLSKQNIKVSKVKNTDFIFERKLKF